MRRVTACAGVALALLVSACDPNDRSYFSEGIGPRLEYATIADVATLESEYIDAICTQAGYPLRPANEPNSKACHDNWGTFVQAGLNDIDRRCDAYLSWLESRRRDREPYLNILTATGAATGAVLNATSAGVVPIAIAAQAFSLASAVYTNWNSRLLLTVDHSTVQTVVYSRQTKLREQIKKEKVVDRPHAIYLLRSYLRLCLPLTIETDINTSVTLVQRGDPAAAQNNPVVKLAGSRTLINDPKDALPPSPPRPPAKKDRYTLAELYMDQTPGEVDKIQIALCVKADGDLGPLGSPTRAAIRDYLIGRRYGGINESSVIQVSDRMRTWLHDAIAHVGDCSNPAFGFLNAFEVGRLGYPANARDRKIKSIKDKLKTFLTTRSINIPPPDNSVVGIDANTRAAIAEFRKLMLPAQPREVPLDRQLDRAVYSKIIDPR